MHTHCRAPRARLDGKWRKITLHLICRGQKAVSDAPICGMEVKTARNGAQKSAVACHSNVRAANPGTHTVVCRECDWTESGGKSPSTIFVEVKSLFLMCSNLWNGGENRKEWCPKELRKSAVACHSNVWAASAHSSVRLMKRVHRSVAHRGAAPL